MQYLSGDARIAGTLSHIHAPLLFHTREEFDEYKDGLIGRRFTLGGGDHHIPNQKLWDEDPERFPCLMIPVAEMHNANGADWIINQFLYDPEIIEED